MLFEVVKAPDGASPQWVRDAWVGVQFEALQGAPMSMPVQSANEARDQISERRGYQTGARDVLGLLSLISKDAARWYIDNAPGMLNPDQIFMFDETCCRAIPDLSGSGRPTPSDEQNNR